MRSLFKSCVGACALMFAVIAPVQAAPALDNPAATYIQKVGDEVLLTISNKSIPDAQKQAKLQRMFKDNLDFEWVSRFVMGRFWRQATDEQKARFIEAYRDFLTKHYTSRFSDYTSGTFKITGARDLDKGETLVNMEIAGNEAGSQPILIDYRVRKTGAGFKVFDITVEGVSLITTQRSEFAAVLNKSGIDGLIEQLKAK